MNLQPYVWPVVFGLVTGILARVLWNYYEQKLGLKLYTRFKEYAKLAPYENGEPVYNQVLEDWWGSLSNRKKWLLLNKIHDSATRDSSEFEELCSIIHNEVEHTNKINQVG